MEKRIFIIDDDPNMVQIATDLLEDEGYSVHSATHPQKGLEQVKKTPPDLILLDIRMPEMDGFELCRLIKSDMRLKDIPVLMVSVKSKETDVIVGLKLGAEDYIRKPFHKGELVQRVKTALRRKESDPQSKKLTTGPFTIDFDRHEAWVQDQSIALSPLEFELLGYFMRRAGHVLKRSTLSEAVWGREFISTSKTVNFHVQQLRKKLGPHGRSIKSIKAVGYRFDPA
jgi:DNA-binding response OmpR family regulator